MFRTISRLFLPNPLDRMLKKAVKRGAKNILLGWNRGLGDIALGLYAIVHRIREKIPDAEITFLIRENLRDGFSLFEGVSTLVAPSWKRGEKTDIKEALRALKVDPKKYDLIIENPSPTDWVRWQRGVLVPRLKWDPKYDPLWQSFGLKEDCTYIGVQAVAETQYGLWRNWPFERWVQLFDRLEKLNVKVLLFGYGAEPKFHHPHLIDLRGKTSLFQLLSIVKHRCKAVILPDSGILSMIYYLDTSFPIQVFSLWADPDHGILKQGVFSPNPKLEHIPMIGELRNLASISAEMILNRLFPAKPLQLCPHSPEILRENKIPKVGVILLAGGQGTRLGVKGPKGTFSILGKSLFERILEKIPTDVPIAVMTSPLNHEETVLFFEKLKHMKREIFFFTQEMLSFLDKEKKPLDAFGPDGNGGVFKASASSHLLQKFEEKGIELISIVPIENPLADPMDPQLLSYLHREKADIAIKCIEKKEADAPMGVLIEREGRLEVTEYTELDPDEHYRYCYTGMMALTISVFHRLKEVDFPLHLAWKKQGKNFVWKQERFLFDALGLADRALALCYPKEQIYAPLKKIENLCHIEEILKEKESSPVV